MRMLICSLDCGVLVLYYMEQMSKMWPILEKFDEDKLLKYKATYLGAFFNDMNLIGRIHRPSTCGHVYVSNI